jgi:hypothetical protein
MVGSDAEAVTSSLGGGKKSRIRRLREYDVPLPEPVRDAVPSDKVVEPIKPIPASRISKPARIKAPAPVGPPAVVAPVVAAPAIVEPPTEPAAPSIQSLMDAHAAQLSAVMERLAGIAQALEDLKADNAALRLRLDPPTKRSMQLIRGRG